LPTAFACVGASIQVIDPFPAPASSNAACGFPALRFPVRFVSRFMRLSLSTVLSAAIRLQHTPPFSPGSTSDADRPSPRRISFDSDPADRWTPLSGRPRQSLLSKESRTAGPLCSAGVTPLPSSYGPSRHRLVFDRFPGGYRLYDLPCSTDFSMGRGRLLQLLSVSLSPCCPYHPAGVSDRISQFAIVHAAFARH
jgi:hypothetical protein